jgi:DnaJ-class molecular chaperone
MTGFFDDAYWTMTPRSKRRHHIVWWWQKRCNDCDGDGWDANAGGCYICPRCKGTGVVRKEGKHENHSCSK